MTDLIAKSLETAAELISRGATEDPELICRQVLKIDGRNSDAMCLLSCCLRRAGRGEESEAFMREAEHIAGESPRMHNSLGISCMHAREIDRAMAHFRRAAELDPEDPDPRFNAASCLIMTGRPREALPLFREAYARSKSHKSMIGIACAKAESLDMAGAADILGMVLEDDPGNPEARTNMASVLHLAGRWEEAWGYHPSRLEHHERLRRLVEALGLPLWTSGPPPKGRILVFSEQGLGDAINFGRMAAVLRSRLPETEAAVLAHPQLKRLLETQGVTVAEGPSGFDACCSMMDIPGLLGMSREEVKESFVRMRPLAECDTSMFRGVVKVGVCWAGNPAHPKDSQRSCELSRFREISRLEGVKVFSLQKDVRPRIRPDSPDPVDLCSGCEDMRLVNMAPHMGSWEDTAAVISGMDFVISVDTSVMHLAASLGKETWGLLPYVPDWRWGLDSESTCWYPTLKLFRQKSPGDWEGVFSAVREELGRKTH